MIQETTMDSSFTPKSVLLLYGVYNPCVGLSIWANLTQAWVAQHLKTEPELMFSLACLSYELTSKKS